MPPSWLPKSKLHPQSFKNQSKNEFDKLTTLGTDFSSMFHAFGTQRNFDEKHYRRRAVLMFIVSACCFKSCSCVGSFLHRCFIHFGSHIASKMFQKAFQKHDQILDRCFIDADHMWQWKAYTRSNVRMERMKEYKPYSGSITLDQMWQWKAWKNTDPTIVRLQWYSSS